MAKAAELFIEPLSQIADMQHLAFECADEWAPLRLFCCRLIALRAASCPTCNPMLSFLGGAQPILWLHGVHSIHLGEGALVDGAHPVWAQAMQRASLIEHLVSRYGLVTDGMQHNERFSLCDFS
jgi:hypothetical protein